MPDIFDQIAPTQGRDIFDKISVPTQPNKPTGFFAPDAFKGMLAGEFFVPEKIAVASEQRKRTAQPFEMQGVTEAPFVDPLLTGTVSGAMVARQAAKAGAPFIQAGVRGMANAVAAGFSDIPIGTATDELAEGHPGLAVPFNILLGILHGVTVENIIDKHLVRRLGTKASPQIIAAIKTNIEKGDISNPITQDVVDEINSNPQIQEAAKQYRQGPRIGDIEIKQKTDIFDKVSPPEGGKTVSTPAKRPAAVSVPPTEKLSTILKEEAVSSKTYDDFEETLVRHGEYPDAVKKVGDAKKLKEFYTEAKKAGTQAKTGMVEKIPVNKAVMQLNPSHRATLEAVKVEIGQGEAGKRIPIADEAGYIQDWEAQPSTYPDYFQSKGYTSKDAIIAIDKALSGGPLTKNQQILVEDLNQGYREKTVRGIVKERASSEIHSMEMEEGQQFKRHGETYTVKEVDQSGFFPKATIKNSETFTIEGDETIKYDRGTLRTGGKKAEMLPVSKAPAVGDIGAIAAKKGKVLQEGLFGGPEIVGSKQAKPISTKEQPGLFAGKAKATPSLPEAPRVEMEAPKEQLPFGVTSGALPSISKEAGHLVIPEGLSRIGKAAKEFFVPLSTLPEGEKYKALRYKSFGDVDRAERFAGKIWDRTKNLTPEVKRDMFRFLDGEVSKESLPANVRPLAQSLQTINNMIGKMLVKKGLLDETIYEAHKGQYIKYLYLKHLLPEDAKLPIGHSGKLDLSYLKGRMDPVIKTSRVGKEYVDKNVYEDILKVAEGLGVTHERRFKAKRGALGYATKGTGETVTQYGTELSVLAHELGHQLDFKYNLWDRIVGEGVSSRGKDVVNKELRALADLTFEGSEVSKYYKAKVRKTAEKMAHMLEAYIHAPTRFKEVAPETYSRFDSFIKSQPETAPLSKILQGLALKEVKVKHYQVVSRGGHAYTSPVLTLEEAKAKLPSVQEQVVNYRKEIGLVEDVSVAEPVGILKPLTDLSKHKFYSEIAINPEWTWQPSVVTVDGKKIGIGALAEEVKIARQMHEQAPQVPEIKARLDRLDTALQTAIAETKNVTADYVQLPTSKSYGPLAGAYIRKEIARDIQPVFSGFNNQGDLSKTVNTIFQIERKSMAMFKVAKTAFNVPTIIRNIGSNIIQLNMSGTPLHDIPGLLIKSASAMKTKDKFYVEGLRNGIFKTNWSEAEIGEVLDTVRTMQKTSIMQMYGQIGKLAKFYGKIDDFYKLAKFIEQREKGIDISKAAIEAHKWGMDYSLAHPAIKIARQHIMPFVSYQYKIAPLIAETLAKRPWVLAKYAAIPYLMYEAAKQTLSLTDNDFEKLKKDLPLYIKKTGSYAVLPWKSPEGNVQWVNLEYFLPWGNVMAIARDVKEGHPRELIGDMGIGNPFLDVYSAIKTAKGDTPPKDPFSGREIWNALDTPTEKSLKLAEWLYGKWAPSMLTREGAGGYTLRVGEKDRYGRTISPEQAAGRWVGLNIIAPTTQQGAIEKRAREKELLSSLYRILKDPTITEEKKQRARDEFLKRAREIRGIEGNQ